MDAFISYMPPFETNGHLVPFFTWNKKQIYNEWLFQKNILQTFCSPKILIYVIFAQHKNTYFSSEKLLFTKPCYPLSFCFLCLCSPPSSRLTSLHPFLLPALLPPRLSLKSSFLSLLFPYPSLFPLSPLPPPSSHPSVLPPLTNSYMSGENLVCYVGHLLRQGGQPLGSRRGGLEGRPPTGAAHCSARVVLQGDVVTWRIYPWRRTKYKRLGRQTAGSAQGGL